MNGESSKKISFGFSKVSKKSNIVQPSNKKDVQQKDNEIQLIDCLEERSIKIIGGEENEKPLPVIAMRNGNQLKDSIKAAVSLRVNKDVEKSCLNKESELSINKTDFTKVTRDDLHQITKETVSTSSGENTMNEQSLTLDELAAKEIIEDTKNKPIQQENEESKTVSVTNQGMVGQKESTLDDYESMPIANFGLAMLRGMGWDPKKGIGLNEQVITPVAPTLRPKGMGLGADKVPTAVNVTTPNGELLVMKKDAPVKILTGLYVNCFGKIAGFDELPGRILVKLAKNNAVISLNELMVQLVSTKEYRQNLEQVDDINVKPEKQQTDEGYGLNVKGKKEEEEDIRKSRSKPDVVKTYSTPKDGKKNYRKEELSSDSDSNRNRKKYRKASNSSDSSPNREVRKNKQYHRSRDDERYEKSSRQKKRRSSSSTSTSSRSSCERSKYSRNSSSSRYSRNYYPKSRNYQGWNYRNKGTFNRNRGSFRNDSEGSSGRNYYSRRPRNKYYNR